MIEVKNLRKTFGHTVAVSSIDLNIAAGEIYGLVGSDGAGKTTTLRLLVGALRPDHGSITVCGYDIAKQADEARANIGYLSQRFSLYEDMTVMENIRFFAEVRGLKSGEWEPLCDNILDFVGLMPFRDRFAGNLSGGMKQKLGLASALVTRPKVLLLDEPTTGVDPVTRQDFWQLIIKLSMDMTTGGFCVLLTTPYMDEAARCNRIGFMRHGKIIAEGTPAEMRNNYSGSVLEIQAKPIQKIKQLMTNLPGVLDVRTFGDKIHLQIDPEMEKNVSASSKKTIEENGYEFIDSKVVAPGLEDVFISLSARDEE